MSAKKKVVFDFSDCGTKPTVAALEQAASELPALHGSEDIRGPLWDAINEYVIACGGDPSKNIYGNTRRQRAVVAVESIVCPQNSD